MHKHVKMFKPVFVNDNDAMVPEVWAQESLMILEANMVAANLVYRDFENVVAQYGDVVNAHRPGTFTAKRKTDTDDVTVQDAVTTNVPVKLNQHLHVSFLIRDGEESLSFKDLVDLHLRPALIAQAQALDQVVLGQAYEFLGNSVGKLGTDPDKSVVIAANEMLNTNKCPVPGRNMLVSPNSEGALLELGDFTKVNESGSLEGLRNANLGMKFNFNFFMSQNVPSVAAGSTVVTVATVNGAHAAGATSIAITHGGCGAIIAGSWVTIAGDMIPHMVTSSTGGATPTAMVISPALASSVLTSAAITIYTPGAVNLLAGYAASYAKELVVNGFSVAPKTGQLLSFGTAADRYSLLSTPTMTSILPNRPLDAAVTNAQVVGIGPAGEYNFGFHRNAIALVVRPLAAPRAGTGALSYVANYNGLSIRVVITYDGTKQGHLVTVDLLAGVKTLDTNLGVVMFA